MEHALEHIDTSVDEFANDLLEGDVDDDADNNEVDFDPFDE
jgi:hypothetical protein